MKGRRVCAWLAIIIWRTEREFIDGLLSNSYRNRRDKLSHSNRNKFYLGTGFAESSAGLHHGFQSNDEGMLDGTLESGNAKSTAGDSVNRFREERAYGIAQNGRVAKIPEEGMILHDSKEADGMNNNRMLGSTNGLSFLSTKFDGYQDPDDVIDYTSREKTKPDSKKGRIKAKLKRAMKRFRSRKSSDKKKPTDQGIPFPDSAIVNRQYEDLRDLIID